MKTATASELKSKLGLFLDEARREPLIISKTGRKVAVLLDWDEYERLTALEDAWWAAKARAAEKGGYLGAEESVDTLLKLLHERED